MLLTARQVSRAQLGQDIGVHEDTISGFAAKGFGPWFIESRKNHSYDQIAGRPKQAFNLYVLLMDEPLAPEDFLAVDRLLAEAVAGAADPVAMVQELLQDLLAMPGPGLADHLDCSQPNPALNEEAACQGYRGSDRPT